MERNIKYRASAFTLVEVIIVVIIVGILAAIAVPMYTSAASVQLSAAANMIASDLEYAKSMAISTGQTYKVVFDTTAGKYSLKNSSDVVIKHPVRVEQDYVISFASDGRLNKVGIDSTTFGGTIKFDYLGTPFDSAETALNSDDNNIILRAEGGGMKVKIESVTGYMTISTTP
jgi:prepilin-type N-terminal cleavage/methylation domain-containing protein